MSDNNPKRGQATWCSFSVHICKHVSATSNTYVVLLSSKPTNKACLLGIGTVSNVACGKTRSLKLENVRLSPALFPLRHMFDGLGNWYKYSLSILTKKNLFCQATFLPLLILASQLRYHPSTEFENEQHPKTKKKESGKRVYSTQI